MAARFCGNCGVLRQVGDAFCQNCGRAFDAPVAAARGRSQLPSPAATATPTALTKAMEILLYIAALASILAFIGATWQGLEWVEVERAGGVDRAGQDVLESSADADELFRMSLIPLGFVLLGAGVMFVAWLFQMLNDAKRRGAHVTWGPGWAIGSWFIPMANLVLPAVVVMHAWRTRTGKTGINGYVVVWWVTLLLGLIGLRSASELYDNEYWVAYYWTSFGATLALIVAAVVCVLVVEDVGEIDPDRPIRTRAADLLIGKQGS